MRLLVCGGRNYWKRRRVRQVLDDLHTRRPISELGQGKARGADQLAREWALLNGVPIKDFEPEWDKHNPKVAPLIRNAEMLEEFGPDVLLAFPGGNGTADMVQKARAAGVEILQPSF